MKIIAPDWRQGCVEASTAQLRNEGAKCSGVQIKRGNDEHCATICSRGRGAVHRRATRGNSLAAALPTTCQPLWHGTTCTSATHCPVFCCTHIWPQLSTNLCSGRLAGIIQAQ